MSNAVKFTPEGGTVVFGSECIGREGMISHNKFYVKDTGVGMSKEFIDNCLFQPFMQEHNNFSAQYAGSGLGLSIVHSLITMMGGRIEVESEVGEGTTFTVYLDLERVDNMEAKKDLQKGQLQRLNYGKSLEGSQILLVEDHPLNAEIAKKLLEKIGCKITWVDNGEKGVETFKGSKENYFDAILMDIRMPVMNGLEATKEIRQLKRKDAGKIPIIAMTAKAYDEDVEKSIEAGMNAHLAKPIEPNKVYETLAMLTGAQS